MSRHNSIQKKASEKRIVITIDNFQRKWSITQKKHNLIGFLTSISLIYVLFAFDKLIVGQKVNQPVAMDCSCPAPGASCYSLL